MSAAPLPDSRVPATHCPECGYRMDGATAADQENAMPAPGDVSVCLNCGQLLTFEDAMTLRKPKREEIGELMRNRNNWAIIEKAQTYIRLRGRFK
jgi:hypothetical protein